MAGNVRARHVDELVVRGGRTHGSALRLWIKCAGAEFAGAACTREGPCHPLQPVNRSALTGQSAEGRRPSRNSAVTLRTSEQRESRSTRRQHCGVGALAGVVYDSSEGARRADTASARRGDLHGSLVVACFDLENTKC